jgi:hypothetical protein
MEKKLRLPKAMGFMQNSERTLLAVEYVERSLPRSKQTGMTKYGDCIKVQAKHDFCSRKVPETRSGARDEQCSL